MANKHGVFIQEEATAITIPKVADGALVIIGSAPVNMVEDPDAVTNAPVLANTAVEAMQELGFVDDPSYTLCQAMNVLSNVYPVSPAVFINVLDVKKHKKSFGSGKFVAVSGDGHLTAPIGTLVDTLKITDTNGDSPATLKSGKDYVTSFNQNGSVLITVLDKDYLEGGEKVGHMLKVEGEQLDPAAVTKEDIIGAYDVATGKETGLEVIRQIYPKLGIVPGILIAPGYSQIPEVGIALMAKAANVNGVFKAMAFLDISTEEEGGARKYTDVKEVKEKSGYTSEFCYNLWPCVKVGDAIYPFSLIAAARTMDNDADNEGVPSASPSNKALAITGTCLADGTEVVLDQDQATAVGEYGVATATNINGFRMWGNHTGAWPASGDAKDVWINVRRMFNWQGNTFILTYFSKVDDPMNNVLIENIVDSENIRCAAYAPRHWAGATIEYLAADNPITDILAGKMTFRQHIAPYTPAETITNILNYDTAMLQAALTGGE